MKHIMIIEDDIHIGNMMEEALTAEGYVISRAYSGTEALLLLDSKEPDLILLDLMLPGLAGEDLITRIEGIPVIVVSARADVDSKVKLLLTGASDYITKPFDIRELLARIEVRLRIGDTEKQQMSGSRLSLGELTLDTHMHRVCIEDREIKLTPTEYAILKLLMENPSQVITKAQILMRIAGDTKDCTESSLKTHISHLRGKLRQVSSREYIESVWGIGFKMKDM